MSDPKPVEWSKVPVNGGRFPKPELEADPKAIRENLKRQRRSHTVKVSKAKLP